jgi:hypothetical protein
VTRRGVGGAVPAVQRRRRPPFPPPVHYPGEAEHGALCRLLNDPHTPREWEQPRAEAWERWQELVTGPDPEGELFRPPRSPGKQWPPQGAVAHDCFGGGKPFHPPSVRTQGSQRDHRWLSDLATAELEHVARFRRREAARAIREPLAHYAALLREVRDDPASRVYRRTPYGGGR